GQGPAPVGGEGTGPASGAGGSRGNDGGRARANRRLPAGSRRATRREGTRPVAPGSGRRPYGVWSAFRSEGRVRRFAGVRARLLASALGASSWGRRTYGTLLPSCRCQRLE